MIANPLKRQALTEAQRRELDTIDQIVMGAAPDQPSDDLQLMIGSIRDSRPTADPDFLLTLDERVGAGFAGPARSKVSALSRRGPSILSPALASVTAIAVVAAIGLGYGALDLSTDEISTQSGPNDGQWINPSPNTARIPAPDVMDSRTQAFSTESGSDDATKQALGTTVAPVGGERARKTERSGFLTLAAPAAEIEDVADDVIKTTDQFGGHVESSSVTGGAASRARANFDLQLPAERFTQALAAYSKLAHVRARNQGTRDITTQFDRNRRRLSELEAERRGLLRQLAAATTAGQTASIKQRLSDVGGKIQSVRSRRAKLVDRVQFVRLAVSIEVGKGATKKVGAFGKALDNGIAALAAVTSVLLVGLAVIAPFGLVAAAIWFGVSFAFRRRRASTLGDDA